MAVLSRNHIVAGFIAGALAVLVFHQGLWLVLYQLGVMGRAPYDLAPTWPFGVPQVLSLAFWGGLWGIAWAVLAARLNDGRSRLGLAFLFGAIVPPLIFVLVVAPLKGIDSGALMNPRGLVLSLLINGVWGLGTELLLRWRTK